MKRKSIIAAAVVAAARRSRVHPLSTSEANDLAALQTKETVS